MSSVGAQENTQPTEEDGLIDQLRRDGFLGPFAVIDWGAASDRGLVRERNDDRWRENNQNVFVLADGMGGNDGGDLAAEVASDTALTLCGSLTDASASGVVDRINEAVLAAAELAGLEKPGTTLVTLTVHQNHVVVLSVGDSRVYRLRDGHLQQLTEDHTVRSELIAAGVPLERAEESSIKLHALTSHIGVRRQEGVGFHVASYSVMATDRFLLCTDGVHGQLSDAEISTAMNQTSCGEASQALVLGARVAGGRDNATAVVLEFGPVGPSADREEMTAEEKREVRE